MSYENCEGCEMYNKNNTSSDENAMYKYAGYCAIIKNNLQDNCPCRKCLIKVMCRYSCEEYDKYVERYNL